ITCAGGEDDGPGGQFSTVGELDDEVLAVRAKTGHLAQHGRFGAEGPGLVEGPVAQVGAADAEGESEVVADQGAGACLAADRLPIDDDGAQSLGGGVHGGRQPGRSGTYRDDVEDALR